MSNCGVRSLSAAAVSKGHPFRCACHTCPAYPVPLLRHAAPAVRSLASLSFARRPLPSTMPRTAFRAKRGGGGVDRRRQVAIPMMHQQCLLDDCHQRKVVATVGLNVWQSAEYFIPILGTLTDSSQSETTLRVITSSPCVSARARLYWY